uniref:Uncharacterized protein n=1 Tax=Setaria viridis TaxID=4556 RepID=A0A4U6VJ19_SETVI|nr:hypothetical protein SEVIR_3G334701v2 [Setaria viridis]
MPLPGLALPMPSPAPRAPTAIGSTSPPSMDRSVLKLSGLLCNLILEDNLIPPLFLNFPPRFQIVDHFSFLGS